MKSANHTKCMHGMAGAAGQARLPLHAHSPARRPLMASDVLSKMSRPPRLTAPQLRDGAPAHQVPRVLHVDADQATALVMSTLLSPEASVVSVSTLEQATELLAREAFALVVLDPCLPDGDAASLLPLLGGARLLVYSASAPEWHAAPGAYLAKPWTSARQLWLAVAGMLGISYQITTGD